MNDEHELIQQLEALSLAMLRAAQKGAFDQLLELDSQRADMLPVLAQTALPSEERRKTLLWIQHMDRSIVALIEQERELMAQELTRLRTTRKAKLIYTENRNG